nr:hypothetical protein [Tanacetum cinerariifolium]GEX86474.1 hypothetical protein [Tanacetum cinerariifolium]
MRIGLLWIWHIDHVSFVVFGECRHGYGVSSLMGTAYWFSEYVRYSETNSFFEWQSHSHFDYVVESLSILPTPFGDSDSLLEETYTLLSYFDDSLPDYEIFCFDIKEKSSGSTTSHFDHSLPDYEAFYFDVDRIEEKSSCSTTSHSDLSLLEYEFDFDLLIDQLPPADRREFTRLLKKNIYDTSTKDLTINEFDDFPLLLSDFDSIFSEEFSEIGLLVSFPSENKDKKFVHGIFIIKGFQSQRFHILPLDDFSTISFVGDSLFLNGPSEIETFLSLPFRNEDKVFDPRILLIDGVLSFTRKTPHLLSDNFKNDKRHILSEISLKIVSSVSFSPRTKEFEASQASDSLINKRFSRGNPCLS